ncbi:MAG: hypothetical protein ABIR47_16500 [Candidatus Kapaibacterium sp.]
MNDRYRVFLVIPTLLLFLSMHANLLGGEPVTKQRGHGSVSIYGGSARASRYYGIDGELRHLDTSETELTATTFGVSGNYGLTNDIQLDAEIPIGYYSIVSQSRFPKRSIFSPTYYGVGATWQVLRGAVNASVSSMVKIPPGFHNGIYDDPKHPSFLSDGYFQLLTSVNVGATINTVWLKGSVGYNYRDEEPLDEIVYSAEIGLSKVEGTGVFVLLNGVQSTGDASQPLRPFYAGTSGSAAEQTISDGGSGRFNTIDRENYIGLGAGAYLGLTDHLVLSGKFAVRLAGVNTLVLSGAYMGLAYNF